MPEKIFTWEDLSDSGKIIQLLFSVSYPNGLTESEMQNCDQNWVVRAYNRCKEAHK